jgi:hypothetical protein
MLGFGYMLLVMLIVGNYFPCRLTLTIFCVIFNFFSSATISIAEHSRTQIGLIPSNSNSQSVTIGEEALDLIES